MQGRKELIPKMLYNVSLQELVPKDNFYRKLGQCLNLHFLRAATAEYYGTEGQESIDPVVFFKILIVGYLNNIRSDRRLIEFCADSLAVRLYLGYDIDEALPWHSTISRTRQVYGEKVFEELFQKVLSLCVAQGMVRGKRQAIDSALIKANASMDSLLEKEVTADAIEYAKELEEQSEFKAVPSKQPPLSEKQPSNQNDEPGGPTRIERPGIHVSSTANPDTGNSLQKDIVPTADASSQAPVVPGEFQVALKKEVSSPQGETAKPKQIQSGNTADSERVSNQTHSSTTDPDARISTKPGKPVQLNYYAQIAVDDAHHVITGALADFASQRDSDCLPEILRQTQENLAANHIELDQIVADTNYSSGSALRHCEKNNIDAYIPNIGGYKATRDGFIFNPEQNQYECQRGNKVILSFRGQCKTKQGAKGDHYKHVYRSSRKACANCPFLESCCGKRAFKEISHSPDKEYYDRMQRKLSRGNTARFMSKRRSSTVEPVLGTLISHGNMERVNARGLFQAIKHVMTAALCYNLKKLLKFLQVRNRKVQIQTIQPIRNKENPKSTLTNAITALMRLIVLKTQKNYIKIQLA